ncbi:non-ribosomal peptide synthetase [Verrucosispora sp. WMMD573]|uniref:non-ribosomal peptide synthetase n=1 Tax=Verrucosispora sp. WMMD573 TaxID=3015149 RepID=UPI00248AB45C|nr:non-ribosomal peptide synthetase [Verrucosispora sp. WMMD573]WBB56643.1 amino acid adenylation domain-containing protein [Verrucosispora sp. WMMD573]
MTTTDSTGSLGPTEDDLIDHLLAQAGITVTAARPVIAANGEPTVLSPGQERLWFLDRWRPGLPLYNVPVAIELTGAVDPDTLRAAVQILVDRHEALRTAIGTEQGQPRLLMAPAGIEVSWRVGDVRTAGAQAEAAALDAARAAVAEPFDLSRAPLLRGGLVRYADDSWLLWLSIHHIACDGQSLEILLAELAEAYRTLVAGRQPSPGTRALGYGDFAAWQREQLTGARLRDSVQWWRRKLTDLPPVLELPADRVRRPVQSHTGRTLHAELSPEAADAVRSLARQRASTVFDVLFAAFALLVGRWSRRTDVVVATPVAGRPVPELDDLVGFFVNTLPLRVDLSGAPSFTDLVARVRAASADAQEHQEVPFAALVEALAPERELAWSPLVQVQFVLQRQDLAGWRFGDDVTAVPVGIDTGTAKFDLTLLVYDAGNGGMRVELEYATDLFDAATMDRFAEQWFTLVRRLAADADRSVTEVCGLPERELRTIEGWSGIDRRFSVDAPIGDLVARHADHRPDHVAVLDGETRMTYEQLVAAADAVARTLRRAGVGRGDMVGVCCRRSADLVVGMLGALRAGAAYVPLDPNYPADRLDFIVRDSGLRVVVAQSGAIPADLTLPDGVRTVRIEEARRTDATDGPVLVAPAVDDPAYLIYTSGSTGRPKAVMVSHRSVLRLFAATEEQFHFGPQDVFSLFHSASFDVSVFETWGALTHGGTLAVVRYWESRDPEAFYELVAGAGVTVLSQTPGAFRQFEAVDERRREELALRVVVFAGEALDPDAVRRWWTRHPETTPEMVNMYGITETTVHTTYCRLTADLLADRHSPIGRQVADLSLHVLDEFGRPTPIGVPGELYVGGDGVAHGYWRRPALTAQRFVADPANPGGRLYRSGDLATWRPDGTLEYLGRLDHQVKIRGFRIEPAEVEAALLAHPAVTACLVIAHGEPGTERRLVGYVVAEGALTVEDVHRFLEPTLPSHLIPSVVTVLDAFPLTANGKIDRKRLPVPGTDRPVLARPYVAPRTDTERTLAEIWATVLELDRVSVEDNFFHLGGDSIRSVQVIGLARTRGLDFSLQQLFQRTTIAALAGEVTTAQSAAADRQPFALVSEADRQRLPEDAVDAYPMAVLQAGMIFHMEADEGRRLYQNVDSFHVRAPFDEALIRRAVRQIVDRHDILRTSFHVSEYSEMLQVVHREAELPIEVFDVRGLDEAEQDRRIVAVIEGLRDVPFDLARPPLWRFVFHWRSAESFEWTLVEHHAILDGWSLHSSITEILQRYMELVRDPSSTAAPKPASTYREFVEAEREALASAPEREFWTEKVRQTNRLRLPRWPQDAEVEALEQPQPGSDGQPLLEWELPPGHSDFYRWLETKIPDELCAGLEEVAARVGVPLKSVLLAAHMRVLAHLTGSREVVTGMAFNGRLEVLDGTESRGLFLNSLPVSATVAGGSWADLIRAMLAEENELLPHRRFPMAEIQRLAGGESLYETHFVYNHFHVMRGLADRDVRIVDPKINSFTTMRVEPTNYPFVCGFLRDPEANGLLMGLDYHTTEFPPEQIRRVRDYYLAALRSIVADADRPLAEVDLTSPAELAQIHRWNRTGREHSPELTVDAVVAGWARSSPGAVAVVDGDVSVSYGSLLARADVLAVRLAGLGVGRGSLVGLCCRRSVDLVVGMLGVLRAGGAYVPLDPDYPAQRLEFMLADTDVRVVVGHRDLLDQLPLTGRETVDITDATPLPADRDAATAPGTVAEDAATLIYTSGSTGRPKGTIVPHRGIIRLLRDTDYVRPEDLRAVGQVSNASFDPLLFEVWGPLLNGGRVVVVPTDVALSPPRFVELLRREQVTAVAIVTALFNSTVNEIPEAFTTLRQVYVGGERINLGSVAAAVRAGGARINNIYGPTEVTSISTCNPLPEVPASSGEIGPPITNTCAYVVDEWGRQVGVGVPGELWLGGPGVAWCYWNRPGLTADRFVPDGFSGASGARLYRTGDVVCWRADGTLEFVGRADHQVKVRGFRVELGEVESALVTHPAVASGAVLALRTGGGAVRLVGYVEPAAGASVGAAQLREFMAERLPEYEVPAAFVVMGALPLTPNGKIDRAALPEPDPERPDLASEHVAPRDALEREVAAIWSDILGVERVGIGDSFFTLGGHSLQAVQVAFRIRTTFGVDLELRRILEAPYVEDLAKAISQALGEQGELLAEALDSVESMSEADVRALLANS